MKEKNILVGVMAIVLIGLLTDRFLPAQSHPAIAAAQDRTAEIKGRAIIATSFAGWMSFPLHRVPKMHGKKWKPDLNKEAGNGGENCAFQPDCRHRLTGCLQGAQ